MTPGSDAARQGQPHQQDGGYNHTEQHGKQLGANVHDLPLPAEKNAEEQMPSLAASLLSLTLSKRWLGPITLAVRAFFFRLSPPLPWPGRDGRLTGGRRPVVESRLAGGDWLRRGSQTSRCMPRCRFLVNQLQNYSCQRRQLRTSCLNTSFVPSD